MLKKVILVFVALAMGPVLAVLTLMAGCFGRHPLFADMCGHNAPITLLLSIVFWFVLISLAIFLLRRRIDTQRISAGRTEPGRRQRSQGDRQKVRKAR
jgi:hypothetical protein